MTDDLLPHCGPILYPGMSVTQTSEGVIATTLPTLIPRGKPEPWIADWIWLDAKEFDEFQKSAVSWNFMSHAGFAVGLFRKKITMEFVPQKIMAWISADVKYRLYINGKMVGRGPAQIGGDIDFDCAPDWWFYDQYDLTHRFNQGENIITVEVLHHLDVGSDFSAGHSGLLFEAAFMGENQKKIIIKSDKSWRAILGEAYLVKTMYDAAYEPGPWHDQNFDDTGWPAAQIVSNVKEGIWHLVPNGINPLMEYGYSARAIQGIPENARNRIQNPTGLLDLNSAAKTVILPGEPVKFYLEFDREISGYLQLAVRAPKGVIVSFGFLEQMTKENFNDLYLTRSGLQSFELFRLRPCRYLRVLIDFSASVEPQTPIEILYIGMNFVSYPVQYIGNFTCSDEILNQIWFAGRWTNQLCMQSYYLDSPVHQEPLGDHGDYMIEALISYYCFGDYALARQDLLKTIYMLKQKDCKMFHTSYSLLWLQMLVEYYDFSGDFSILPIALSLIHRLLERFHGYLGDSGLVTEAPNYMFFDWITVDGFELHHPPCVIGQGYLSAFYFQALKNGAKVCEACDDHVSQAKYLGWASKIATAFHQELWIPEKQMYCDGRPGRTHVAAGKWLPADPNKIYFSKHTNSLAVLYGLVPETKSNDLSNARALMHRVMTDDSMPMVQPYFMHFVLNALSHVDLFDSIGLREIRKWKLLLDEHPTSLKESWTFGDYSHAWSGTPTYQMSARLLGATPVEPGFSKVRLSPAFGDLSWANGTIPTRHGSIIFGWKKSDHEISCEITIPPRVFVELLLPLGESASFALYENGDLLDLQNDHLRLKSKVVGQKDIEKNLIRLELHEGIFLILLLLKKE